MDFKKHGPFFEIYKLQVTVSASDVPVINLCQNSNTIVTTEEQRGTCIGSQHCSSFILLREVTTNTLLFDTDPVVEKPSRINP